MGWRMNDDQVISFGERCIFSRLEIHAVFAVFGCYIKVCFCMLLFVLSYIRRTLQDKVTGRHLSLNNLYVLLNLYAGDKCPELRTSVGPDLSGAETVNLISRLFDSKLDKKFSEFKRGLDEKEIATTSSIKTTKATNGSQFKENKVHSEFNSGLLDTVTTASSALLESTLVAVIKELESLKEQLNKRNKLIRFAD